MFFVSYFNESNSFVGRLDKDLDVVKIEKTISSQLKAAEAPVMEKDSSVFSIYFRTGTYLFRNLTAEQIYDLLILIFILKDSSGGKNLKYMYQDFVEYLSSKTITQSEKVSTFLSLDVWYQKQLVFNIIQDTQNLRFFCRRINSKTKKEKSIYELFLSWIEKGIFPVFINKRRPRRIQHHKGYRDHGSLGSEFSRTLQQQASDFSIEENERRKRKEKQDYLSLIKGILD